MTIWFLEESDKSWYEVIPARPGGGGISSAQLTAALASKADQSALDALAAANATQAELDAINSALDLRIAAKPDVRLSNAVRQPDGSILLSYSDSSTNQVATDSTKAPLATVQAHIADGLHCPDTTNIPTGQAIIKTATGYAWRPNGVLITQADYDALPDKTGNYFITS